MGGRNQLGNSFSNPDREDGRGKQWQGGWREVGRFQSEISSELMMAHLLIPSRGEGEGGTKERLSHF